MEGLAGLRVPTMLMAGGRDDVSVYSAMRTIFDEAVGTDRHLLTFDHANHNAAAPMPAPIESWAPVEGPCCTNQLRDSFYESSVVAGGYEQLVPYEVQDQELAFVQHGAKAARFAINLV
ncbi:hypothetical protein [Tateyamaria sp.]|uniref:hypothetical protein n=1 Tax=Tateyamaria sp. TaxID=1929288 RepID=UPI003B228B78